MKDEESGLCQRGKRCYEESGWTNFCVVPADAHQVLSRVLVDTNGRLYYHESRATIKTFTTVTNCSHRTHNFMIERSVVQSGLRCSKKFKLNSVFWLLHSHHMEILFSKTQSSLDSLSS